MDRRTQLLDSVKGQRVRIPDLSPIFAGWLSSADNVNPYWKPMVEIANEKLQSVFTNQTKLAKLRAADFALFASTWWPQASFEELRILTFLSIWLFTWDDEIDEPTGFCTDDLETAHAYRLATISFVEACLGVGKGENPPLAFNAIIESFREIGQAFCDAYNLDQRKRLFEEIVRFLAGSNLEQQIRLSGKIPTVEEYWDLRMKTSAVGVGSAALEYANQVRIPQAIHNDTDMKAIWDETNRIISITNDLLSLKKEMASGCIDSIVPLSCAGGMDAQSAVDAAVKELQTSKNRFELAADNLIAKLRQRAITSRHILSWIQGCRFNCVGNVIWSYTTARYGVSECMEEDGSVSFVL